MTFIQLADESLAGALTHELSDIEARLTRAASVADPIINESTNHLIAAGGKRLRPLLVLLVSELGSGVSEEVRQAAVATELTHLATLYHDDVMDSAPLRRGAPSAHQVWGNSVAILTGDLLLARVSQIVAELGPQAVRIQAVAFERLVHGQLQETLGPQDEAEPVEHYVQVLADKTGSLIAAAAHYGAVFGGLDAVSTSALVAYAENLGIAFQLADDVIDLVSDSQTTGKTPGTDLREGVPTLPTLLLQQQHDAGSLDADGQEILQLLAQDLSSDAALAAVVARLREHVVVDEARDVARSWVDRAIRELEPIPQSPAREALVDFAQLMVARLA